MRLECACVPSLCGVCGARAGALQCTPSTYADGCGRLRTVTRPSSNEHGARGAGSGAPDARVRAGHMFMGARRARGAGAVRVRWDMEAAAACWHCGGTLCRALVCASEHCWSGSASSPRAHTVICDLPCHGD
eukprot:7298223-Prymnesium_polylepis.1